jgi:hypothetical protein
MSLIYGILADLFFLTGWYLNQQGAGDDLLYTAYFLGGALGIFAVISGISGIKKNRSLSVRMSSEKPRLQTDLHVIAIILGLVGLAPFLLFGFILLSGGMSGDL